jgi:hypothetical protein
LPMQKVTAVYHLITDIVVLFCHRFISLWCHLFVLHSCN